MGLPHSPSLDAPSAAISSPEAPNLAEDTLLQRAERRSRDRLIEAGSQLKLRVSHPDGGDCTVEEILAHEAVQRTEIGQATAAGSRMHRRLPGWMRSIPKYVLGFDFGLLLYFFAGITNVNWTSLLSLALAFAILLAAMVTLLSYGFLSFTGHRLRSHKNHAGTIHREDVDGITAAAFVVAIVVIVVLAMLMFLRIRTEVLDALGGQAQITALAIAVAVAVVNAVANFLVVAVHALDGSDQTARLDKLSAAIRGPSPKRTSCASRRRSRSTARSSSTSRDRGPGTLASRAFDCRSGLRTADQPVTVEQHSAPMNNASHYFLPRASCESEQD